MFEGFLACKPGFKSPHGILMRSRPRLSQGQGRSFVDSHGHGGFTSMFWVIVMLQGPILLQFKLHADDLTFSHTQNNS